MKKFSVILSSLLLIIFLSTFNPNKLQIELQFFKIKEIEIKNLKYLNEKEIKHIMYDQLIGTNLIVLNKKKINKIFSKNKLIDFVEFKRIYPSTLQIIIHEKETIAIINYKKKKFYLTKNGEEIKYFQNSDLERLPNIFGEQKNFLEVYYSLKELNFPTKQIKSFYHFEIGRWDILLNNNKIIKLPIKNFNNSLKNFMELKDKINYEKYLIFDYRIDDQLILN